MPYDEFGYDNKVIGLLCFIRYALKWVKMYEGFVRRGKEDKIESCRDMYRACKYFLATDFDTWFENSESRIRINRLIRDSLGLSK